MARKNPSRRPAAVQATATRSITPRLADDLGGQQFAVAVESGAVLLRGLQEMRNIQNEAARQATQRHAAARASLGAAPGAIGLLTVQSDLLRRDIEEATRCWQLMMGEALEIHSELLACATRLVNTEDMFAAARLLHA